MIKKAAPLVGALRRLNRCTPPHLLRSIYFAQIHSRLSYLSPIWGASAPSYKLNDIQTLQNKAIRSIFNVDYYSNNISTENILKKYHIFNVAQLIQYNTTILYHQIKNKTIKWTHNPILNHNVHSYPTRIMNDVRIPKSNNNYGQQNTLNLGARLYNSLADEIKQLPTLKSFKFKLKKYILDVTP